MATQATSHRRGKGGYKREGKPGLHSGKPQMGELTLSLVCKKGAYITLGAPCVPRWLAIPDLYQILYPLVARGY